MTILPLILALPLVGALIVSLLPSEDHDDVRGASMVATVVTFIVSLVLWSRFDASEYEILGILEHVLHRKLVLLAHDLVCAATGHSGRLALLLHAKLLASVVVELRFSRGVLAAPRRDASGVHPRDRGEGQARRAGGKEEEGAKEHACLPRV